MSKFESVDLDAPQRLRAKRLNQISSMVVATTSIALFAYLFNGNWEISSVLSCIVLMMFACRWLSLRGKIDVASVLLLSSLTAGASTLMWISEGLQDTVFLTYPVILIMAGLLVSRRFFFLLLAVMLTYTIFLSLATEVFGWRVNVVVGNGFDLMRDALLILGACGFAVWVIVNDLSDSLLTLRAQIDHYSESQKHLTYLSQHDSLTGLPNRAVGRDRIAQAIRQAERDQNHVALLFVDLDNFKVINDTLGHSVGDDYLRQVASRLTQSVRKSDVVSRHGGDEFIVGLTELTDIQDASAIATAIMGNMALPLMAKTQEIVISCSIGIALYPDDGLDYDGLLRLADIAMYQAKESGRNAYCFYDAQMNANMQQNLLLVSELRLAVARREFVVHYQPVLNLETGALAGAEALVRWQHPTRGLVAPDFFISAAEKSGLILELGNWVLQEACQQMVQWRSQGATDLVIAVNLSPVQFRRGNVAEVVHAALQKSGLPAHCLELEITESTLVQDSIQFMDSLQALKKLGVRISIDDFGTGYSNLSYLQRFAVDKLKVDQSFVKHLMRGSQDVALVRAIIQMARSLNLSTTAEGIEDASVHETLKAMGCEMGQGYFYSRPISAEEFGVWVNKSKASQ